MDSLSIGPQQRVRAAESVHARAFDDELVLLDLEGGQYFSLDGAGVLVWEGLSAGRSPEEVAADVAREYAVEPARALADLLDLANDMVKRGLLVPQGKAGK